ncbi:hypothetical protein ACX31A_15400 [Dermacoccus nishinomiyaensis]
MLTPYGHSIAGPYPTRADFYRAHPHLDPQLGVGYTGTAPAGYTLLNQYPRETDRFAEYPPERWLIVYCHPLDEPAATYTDGVLAAFNHLTGDTFTLAEGLTLDDAFAMAPGI